MLIASAIPCGFGAFAVGPIVGSMGGSWTGPLSIACLSAAAAAVAAHFAIRPLHIVAFAATLVLTAGIAAAAIILAFSSPDDEWAPSFVALLLGLVVVLCAGVGTLAAAPAYMIGRRSRFFSRGVCPSCRYDLSGLPAGSPCPECAAAPP
jgi:hypothetical protein